MHEGTAFHNHSHVACYGNLENIPCGVQFPENLLMNQGCILKLRKYSNTLTKMGSEPLNDEYADV